MATTATNGRPSAAGARILAEAGPTVSVRDAARVLGVCSETVYAMNRRGDLAALGIRVLTLGRALRVVTVDLRRAVGEAAPDGGAVA